MQVSCKELRKRAWEKLSHGNYWTSVLVTLAVSIANGVAGVFTSGPLAYGSSKFFLCTQRNQDANFEMLGDGFNRYGKTFLTGLALMLFMFLWSLVIIVPQIIFSVCLVWIRMDMAQTIVPPILALTCCAIMLIMCWLPIVKSLSYRMTFYVMVDFNLSGRKAISKSVELMKGHKAKLFRLGLSFFGWYLLSSLTFGIGAIFLAPYVQATVAEFYAELLDCHGITPEQSPENDDNLKF